MYLRYIIIFLLILFILFIFRYNNIKKEIILYTLKNFKKGNFALVKPNGEIILKVVNNKNDKIPVAIIYNENKFFSDVLYNGETGLGESYVSKYWTSNDLVNFLDNIYINQEHTTSTKFDLSKLFITNIINKTLYYDKQNIKHHYDIGNDFYMLFLKDDLSAYTCGIWLNPNDTLNDAQYNKVNIIIDKMNPMENSKILDIGCGWGKIANYVAKKTNSKVYGITISDEQEKYALKNYSSDSVIIRNMNYRHLLELNEKYDCIYTIGMIEHIRYENYTTFFNVIKHCLKYNGRYVLHTIISFDYTPKKSIKDNTFITKHIFPGGQIPNNEWIIEKVRECGLNIVHSEIFGGQHYAKTVKVWRYYLLKNKEYIINNYSEDLFLKYDYYLSSCESAFNSGIMGIGHYVIVNQQYVNLNNSFNYNCV